jgi:general stress protein 26
MTQKKPQEEFQMAEQQKFEEVLSSFKDAMLTTIVDGVIAHSRPMRIADISEDATLWFVTNRHSAKVDEILHDANVVVTMQGEGKFLSLNGKAQVVEDRQRIQELWSEKWKVWFPKGQNDPQVTLLAITPDSGEYWDVSGLNALRFYYEASKSYFTGRPFNESDNRYLNAQVDFGAGT